MSNMNLQQLKDYLKCVFELEGQLYKHQKLVEGYTKKRNSGIPVEPARSFPTQPTPPSLITAQQIVAEGSDFKKAMIALTVFLSSIFFAPFLILIPLLDDDYSPLMIWGIICVFIAIASWKPLKEAKLKQENKAKYANASAQQNYLRELENFRAKEAEARRVYDNKMLAYMHARSKYNRETSQQLAKFDEIKNSLLSSLTKLYSQNIIYVKYRNLVAIATIYEYFDSGRCTELEGPNGAYNMYEIELRSNIIICSLAQIISDLAQIKNGQYALYEQINRSNLEVTKILGNIYDEQILTAYYAEVASKVASADRYTVGVIC